MFDFVRKHNKLMQIMLFLLIVPSFVMFGIDGYTRFREKGEAAAMVAGETISQSVWDQAHVQESERLRKSSSKLDPTLLDSPLAKYATLEKMIRERVLFNAAAKSHIAVSDQRLANELQQNEDIRSLRGPDGKLDLERYRQALSQQGLTPELFEGRLRSDLASRQVMGALFASGISVPGVADTALNAYFQRRTIAVARFDAGQTASKMAVSDAEVEQYYKDHLKEFQVPEQASVEYLVLDLDAVRKTITLNEADLKSYYDQNASRLGSQEERRASHILISSPKGTPAAERQKAKDKAAQILAAVKKAPQTFADAARKESQDPGSASLGGDLDFFAHGAMTKPFEDVVFAMKKGDISDVVETEFGYHIILLTDIKAPKQRSFEEMRKEIEADVRKQQTQRKYAEYAEAFSNAVYEQSDTFKPIADRLKLEVHVAQKVTRKPDESVTGPLVNAKFLSSLFSADSIEKKRNTQAVETDANTMVSGRLIQYTPAHTLELSEVKDKAKAAALLSKGAQVAQKEGVQKLTALQSDANAVSFPAPQTIGRLDRKGLSGQIVLAAMRGETAKLPSYVGVDLGAQGYAIIKITEVLGPEDASVANSRQARGQYTQWWTAAESLAYYNTLKEKFKVAIKVTKPSLESEDAAATAK